MLLLLACVEGGPTPIVDEAGDFFDAPFPSDSRRSASGGLDYTGFPGRDDQPLLDLYCTEGELSIDGAGTTAPITFRFDGELDESLLPKPLGTLYPSSAVFLIDVDPDSPDFGARVPVEWDFQVEDTTYQPTNLLTLAPLPGIPLRPGTTYAAGVTTRVASPSPDFAEVWTVDHPDHERYAGLQAALLEDGTGVEEVAIATVFTTQDPVDETAIIASHIQDTFGVQDLSQSLTLVHEGNIFLYYEGELSLPVWQHGERPYASEGGQFVLEDGTPQVYAWERVTFSFTVPKNEDPPAGGWPVVLYAHGTGGDWSSCCSYSGRDGQAARAAEAGLAMLGFSQPLHGDRKTSDTNEEIHTFNYFNPASATANFRQGALDIVYLSHVLSGRSHAFDLGGDVHPTDPDLTLFMGHSQGGITGAIALPFIGDDIRGAVLSGAGGGLSLSMVYRKQGGLDIEELITGVLDFDSDEELDPLHPVAGLLQTLAERTDSANYAPYWFDRRTWFTGSPTPVLMFEGMLDVHTPPITSEALAAAAGVPIMEPSVSVNDANRVLGIGTVVAPANFNVETRSDGWTTAGLAQYEDQDHFAINDLAAAQRLYRDFLASVVAGDPRIGEPR